MEAFYWVVGALALAIVIAVAGAVRYFRSRSVEPNFVQRVVPMPTEFRPRAIRPPISPVQGPSRPGSSNPGVAPAEHDYLDDAAPEAGLGGDTDIDAKFD
jgi:hypothetical protein